MNLTVLHQRIAVKYYGELPGLPRGVGAGLNGDVPMSNLGHARFNRVDHDELGNGFAELPAMNGQFWRQLRPMPRCP